jgi:hypothetical protein
MPSVQHRTLFKHEISKNLQNLRVIISAHVKSEISLSTTQSEPINLSILSALILATRLFYAC